MDKLDILGWEEHRGIIPKKSSDGSYVESLLPAVNTIVALHLRAPDGLPFTVTLDGETFSRAVLPNIQKSKPSWDHVYLLGWYDELGKGYLTTWDGDRPVRSFIVTGVTARNMPLWDAPIPSDADIHLVPAGKDPAELARELGGFHVIGWYVPRNERKKA